MVTVIGLQDEPSDRNAEDKDYQNGLSRYWLEILVLKTHRNSRHGRTKYINHLCCTRSMLLFNHHLTF